MKPSEQSLVISAIPAGFAVWGLYAMGLGAYWWLPWLGGLIVWGGVYSEVVQIRGHERMADRDDD